MNANCLPGYWPCWACAVKDDSATYCIGCFTWSGAPEVHNCCFKNSFIPLPPDRMIRLVELPAVGKSFWTLEFQLVVAAEAFHRKQEDNSQTGSPVIAEEKST